MLIPFALLLAEADWMSSVFNYGVPTGLLMLGCLGVWKVIVWVGRELIIPFRDKGLYKLGEFFDRLNTTLEITSAHVKQQTDTIKDIREGIARIETVRCAYGEEVRLRQKAVQIIRPGDVTP